MTHPNQPTNIVALSPNLLIPVLTSLTIEYEKVQEKVYNATQSNEAWEKLKTYQVLCCALIEKYTLKDEQTFAFLIVADNHG